MGERANISTKNTSSHNGLNGNNAFFFQPKLTINQPGDAYEQEADEVADKVMRMNYASSDKKFFLPSIVQRKCAHCEEEEKEKKLQRRETVNEPAQANGQTEKYIGTLSGGSPLDSGQQNFFGSRMGYDFSGVRIHNDSNANASAKNVSALAYTHGNDIVFGSGQYQPNTDEGKKILAHELTHVIQQNIGNSKQIQSKAELDKVTEKDQYTKCLAAIENVIKKLEANASKEGMPDDIKEAIKLLRKKFTENKIKCYYLDGIEHGITNFTTGEIYMDAKLLKDTTDTFANIGEGNLLHEGIHALHNEKYPASTKKYGKVLDDQEAGKSTNLSETEQKELQKLKAWTEYWAYRKMREYNNITYNQGKDDETIHSETLMRMKEEGGIAALNVVWAFEPKWDPRKWKPKN